MLKLVKAAITGDLGSGKTTVCQIFEKLGASVLSADKIVHQLLSSHTRVGKEVIKLLGEGILCEGEIDRKAIAEIVFQNHRLLLELEKIVHPAVLQEIRAHFEGKKGLFIVEVPLLYEAHFETEFDKVILVTADEAVKRTRITLDKKEYEERMMRLMPIKEKIAHADFVISNNGSLEELTTNVTNIYSILRK